MVLAKSKNAVGLGNSLMNDRFGKGKGADRRKVTGIQRTDTRGQTYVTNDKAEAAWVKMRSVTEQGALDEFLSTAELAGTDFTAEKLSHVKIIHSDQRNPYLLSATEERSALRKQMARKHRLTVPRRPPWTPQTTPAELDRAERESLLEWRRGLADLQENDDLLMTPFERNLEVWRQLWRVIERSDLIVQIVDARNPLVFRSEDLESYVHQVDPQKRNLLLVNKADMMTPSQRKAWAQYFKQTSINYSFFSASLAKQALEDANDSVDDDVSTEVPMDPDTRILSIDELDRLFLENVPNLKGKATIGLVGYPNVGKSSTINALIGAKKVSVSATPGKTKHFQTIHLSSDVVLCDCPGLVFPNFATTKAELVCNGILPIDQLREFTGPAGLVAQRIPKEYVEALYGISIAVRPAEEGGSGVPTAEELLRAYARARGFAKTGIGEPDESRAARHILKDYVNGKLLFCHPPPGSYDALEFNRDLYTAPPRRSHVEPSQKSQQLDTGFFARGQGNGGHLSLAPNQQQGLSGRKLRAVVALEKDVDPADVRMSSKKHYKGR